MEIMLLKIKLSSWVDTEFHRWCHSFRAAAQPWQLHNTSRSCCPWTGRLRHPGWARLPVVKTHGAAGRKNRGGFWSMVLCVKQTAEQAPKTTCAHSLSVRGNGVPSSGNRRAERWDARAWARAHTWEWSGAGGLLTSSNHSLQPAATALQLIYSPVINTQWHLQVHNHFLCSLSARNHRGWKHVGKVSWIIKRGKRL